MLNSVALGLDPVELWLVRRSNPNRNPHQPGAVRVFRQEFTLEDAIGSHACSLEALCRRVINGIPLGCSLLLPVGTVNCVQILKERLLVSKPNPNPNPQP
jgi:hypothetical protein